MSDKPPLSYEYHVILGRADCGKVLLLPGEDGWRLPGFVESERRHWQDVDHVACGLSKSYGAQVNMLRCAAIDYERDSELIARVYVAELQSQGWQAPSGAIWAGQSEVAGLQLALPRQRAAIDEWFGWYTNEGPAPPQRAAWYIPGWHAKTSAWISEQLQVLGIEQIGPVTQLRSWQRSAIWRVPTEWGEMHFKAVPPMFGHEAGLTAALATIAPRHVVGPVAADSRRGWMLLPAVRGASLDEQPEIELWEAALRSFARLQIASTSQTGRLRSAGAPDRPLTKLASQIAPLLGDVEATLPGRPAGLSAEQRADLASLVPRLREMCAELSSYGLPASIEHGDLWANQIIAGAGGFHILDWSDSAIGHPFFSLLLLLLEVEDHFPKEPGVRNRLRDAYLEPWASLLPRRRLERAFELSQPLAALHHAITYQQIVLPQIEVAWEIDLMLPFYLKMVLRLVR
ncbi:MAG: phosphotransferase [Oscillochloris sp.]|nr:phosphotransferase [Oscillochloris sp.]